MLHYHDLILAVVFQQYDTHLIDPFEEECKLLVHQLMYQYWHQSKSRKIHIRRFSFSPTCPSSISIFSSVNAKTANVVRIALTQFTK